MFKPDNYKLAIGLADFDIELNEDASEKRLVTQQEDDSLPEAENQQQMTGDSAELLELFKSHSASLIAMGNDVKKRY